MVGCLVLPLLEVEAEVRRRPELARVPFAIAAQGRVRAVSEAAAQGGVTIGLPTGRAQTLFPDLVLLAYDVALCSASQQRVLELCADYVETLEPASVGELFLRLPDVSWQERFLTEIATAMTARLDHTCEFGGGPSKLIAKAALLSAPGTVVAGEDAARFLAPLPIARLWTLDPVTIQHLRDLGLSTIGLLQQVPEEMLARQFGARARSLKQLALGVDHAPVRALYPPPQASARSALLESTQDGAAVEAMLREIASAVAAELAAHGQVCQRVALRVELERGRVTRRCALSHPTGDEQGLLLAARRLLERAQVRQPVLALSLRASELERRAQVQLALPEEREARPVARPSLAGAVDLVRHEFGERAAWWAGERDVPRRERMLRCWRERP